MAVPACEMASNAYSTWYRRPSGEKMVVCGTGKLQCPPSSHDAPLGRWSCSSSQLTRESYLLDMVARLEGMSAEFGSFAGSGQNRADCGLLVCGGGCCCGQQQAELDWKEEGCR
jgi:hypothetical protein